MIRPAVAQIGRLRGDHQALRGAPVAVVDVETTGLEPTARVVQIAVVVVDALGTAEPRVMLDTLVNPGHAIPAEATRIHGISTEDVAGAPSFAEIADQLAQALEGRIVAAYNAPFDVARINHELRLARRPEIVWDPLDPLVWVKRADKYERGKRLADAAARRGIVLDAHGAAGDATVTAMLMPRLLRELAAGGHCRVADLQTRDAFARWQRAAALEVELEFARFQLSKGKTGPWDLAWHAMEGEPVPPEFSVGAPAVSGPTPEQCRTCRAPILWQVTKAGKAMPLDPAVLEVVTYDPAETDPVVHKNPLETLVTSTGDTVRGWTVPAGVRPDLARVSGRISHFATCPSAGRHRRAS